MQAVTVSRIRTMDAQTAVAVRETLRLLRRAAVRLAEMNATDPTVQRHLANVCNEALDILHDETGVE